MKLPPRLVRYYWYYVKIVISNDKPPEAAKPILSFFLEVIVSPAPPSVDTVSSEQSGENSQLHDFSSACLDETGIFGVSIQGLVTSNHHLFGYLSPCYILHLAILDSEITNSLDAALLSGQTSGSTS